MEYEAAVCCMDQRRSIYDCQTCGACCASPWRDAPGLYLDDYPIEPALREVKEVETCLTPEGLRVCTALAGCIGVRCECTIYERRPKACESLEIGGPRCRKARQFFGLPV